uniref:Putative lectin/glucanase superfamily protein n=2 Tax=viral metagenome TaxID=1070528 RepID=A0A6M3IVP1_9ZZZZ
MAVNFRRMKYWGQNREIYDLTDQFNKALESLQISAQDVQSKSITIDNINWNISAGDGLTIDQNGIQLVLKAGGGLDVDLTGLSVDCTDIIDTSYGLTESSNKLQISLDAASGLEFNAGVLRAKIYTDEGLERDSNGLSVDVTDIIDTNYGLTEDTNNIRINLEASGGLDFATGALGVDVTDFIDTNYGLTEDTNNIRINLEASGGLDFATGALGVDVTDFIDTAYGLTETSNNIQINLEASGGLDFAAGALGVDVTDFIDFNYGLTEDSNNIRVNIEPNEGIYLYSYGGGDGANDKLLLHLNGADGDTSTTDSSTSAHTIVFHGNAQLDTADKKWGTASLLCDGTTDYLSINDSADWDICASAVDSWTIDFWIKFNVINPVANFLVTQYESIYGFWVIAHYPDSGLGFMFANDVGLIIDTGTGGIISDTTTWHHVALCKVAEMYGMYLDGQQVTWCSDSSTDTLTGALIIGAAGPGTYSLNGWMDEVKITHENYFSAAPNSGKSDTITVPTSEYGASFYNYTLAVDYDDSTIGIVSTKLAVKTNGINDTHIDWGTGTNQVSAVDMPIADAGSLITATDVEAALQEVFAKDPTVTLTGDVTGTGTHTNLGNTSFTTTIVADAVHDTMIDWGTGAGQVSADDVPDGSTNAIITLTQETNFETAYSLRVPVVDTQTIVKGSVDATKLIRFEIDGLTTSTTRVLTVQDKDITIADNADIPTISDVAYDTTTWDANTDGATKNAIRDKIETMDTAIGLNTSKVTESTTVTSPLVLTTYDISIPAATNAAAGHATAAHITAIEANTAHVSNDGTDHGYIDQDLQTIASPSFVGLTLTGEANLKLYSQDAEPSLGADGNCAFWKDTNDFDRIYLVFRRGTGDQVKIELT